MAAFITCMKEEDPYKKKTGAGWLTRLYVVFFSDAQGQLTPKSVVEFCRNSNSSKRLWLSSSSARIKKIQSKMRALEAQDFLHCKYMGFFFQTLKGS